MKNEKEYTEGISIEGNKFLSWLDNFWYHYKWHTIVSIFLIIVFGICTFQMCTKKNYNVILTYAGPKEFITTPQEKININSSLSNAAVDQYGESAAADLHTYIIYSKDQIAEIESETGDDGKKIYKVDTAQITKNMQELETFSQVGDSYIFLLDPYVYEHLKGQPEITDRFVKISEVFGENAQGTYDECAIKLVDTDFYKNNPSLHVLPEDTLICLHVKLLYTKQSEYDDYFELFKNIAKVSAESEKTETAN